MNGLRINVMVKESTITQTVINMMVSGRMIKYMAKEFTLGKMDKFMKVAS